MYKKWCAAMATSVMFSTLAMAQQAAPAAKESPRGAADGAARLSLELDKGLVDASSVLAEGELLQIMNLADGRFSSTEVCEDYEIAMHLLALIQAPQGHRGNNTSTSLLAADLKNCPGTFSGVARILRQRVQALGDYHTAYRAGLGLDTTALSTITACSAPTSCGQMVGLPLIPLMSEVSRKLYGYAPTAEGGFAAFEIESLNGKSGNELFVEVKNSQLVAKTDGGTNGRMILPLLSRQIFDGRDRATQQVQARLLSTGERFTLTTSFEIAPDRKLTPDDQKYLSLFYANPSYGCKEISEGSTPAVGACLTEQNRLVVWIFSWVTPEEGIDVKSLIGDFLYRHRDKTHLPVVLDTRGNTGGNPYLPAQFLCSYGDDRSVREMKRRHLVASRWPKSFTLSSGRIVETKSLELGAGNADLVRIDESWDVFSKEPTSSRRDFMVDYFSRGKITDAACLAERDHRLSHVKWIVLTNGTEFSAAENFLSFIEESVFKFKIMGNSSWGGTGAPMIVTLPNTRMKLRLSLARHIDGIDGSFNIEGVGVQPHQPILRATQQEFERLVLEGLETGELPQDSSHASYLFRQALKVRM